MKFAVSGETRTDHEAQTVAVYCALNDDASYKIYNAAKDVPSDCIPVGTVKWVEEVLQRQVVPDYYPDFLTSWLHRKVWKADKWPYGSRVFIKPADRHKRFTGLVTNGRWKGKKRGPYWCSDIVEFESEWRWYVASGKVIAAKWGSGKELPVPDLNIQWPRDYCAAVDFGLLSTGEIALVESNSPFACGWYGSLDESSSYIKWLAECWTHLQSAE